MKHSIYILINCLLALPFSIKAQIFEGSFSCQGEEEVTTSTIQLTAIVGQPFEGTVAGSTFSYGFIETVSTANEYTDVTALTLGEHEVSVEVGESVQLSVTFSPEVVENPTVSWFSSDPAVATVKDGRVVAKGKGVAVVTVVSACGVYADQCNLTVTQSEPDPEPEPDPILVTGISLEPEEVVLEIGETIELEATVYPHNADDRRVEWSSSDESVATVQDGVVTAMDAGTATISVTTVDGGYKATCTVTVNDDPTSVENVGDGNCVSLVGDYLHLELQKPQVVHILNVGGKMCDIIQCQSGQSTVSMQEYPAGIYFVRMEREVVKVVKR
ncbi:Ig-like domain-containing protein [Parabacteroides johnsonii]|jgi:protein containing cell adhesion domain protein|uniref:Ig-like domain-containing protein n=1 Tax=Parabacteroides johnsonii TaxID=387661 RepID=UPI001C3940E3|nr:Ig-like domain-containing protein [Parabacteroides johnsonii]MBV4243979.1 Ig-like domain-containing protein [Parabacteroides johnsonii]